MSDPTIPPPLEPPVGGSPTPPPPPGMPSPAPKPSRRRRVLLFVIGLVVAIVVAVLVRVVLTSVGPSKQEVIDKAVAQIKEQTPLPKQVDSVTSWTDVTAEPGAIRYVYTIDSSVAPSAVSATKLRDAIGPSLCTTPETRKILDADITMKYHYAFPGSPKSIDLAFTKADC